MSRNGAMKALPPLTSYLTTLGIGNNAARQSLQAVAEGSSFTRAGSAGLAKTLTNKNRILQLLQEQHSQQPTLIPRIQDLQFAAKLSQSRASASDLFAALHLRAGTSNSPSSVAYAAVRQQHANAAPPVSSSSAPAAAAAAPKVPPEAGGGNPESDEGGSKKGFFSNLQDVPIVPLLLGLAGAIPFVALAPPIAPLLPLPEDMYQRRADWHAAYGAAIASFLGAVHWGLAMAEHAPRGSIASFSIATLRYTWGVIPALLAWPALLLAPADKFAALSGTIGLAFLVDSGFAYFKLLPKWYMPLRLSLTVLAVGGLASSWSVAAVKSTYNRARTFELGKEEAPPTILAKPERKVP